MSEFPRTPQLRPDWYLLGLKFNVFLLFALFPLVQLVSNRSATFFLIVSFFGLVVGLLASKSTGYPVHLAEHKRSGAGTGQRLLLLAGAGLLGYSLFSLVWSPLPLDGAKDILVVSGAIVAFWLISREYKLVDSAVFRKIFLSGIIVAMGAVALDMQVFRTLYNLLDANNQYFDLNRNAATLALLVWPAMAMVDYRSLSGKGQIVLVLVLCLIVVFSSDSQSAQLGILTGLVAGALTWFSRVFFRIILILMIAWMFVFPLIVPSLPGLMDSLPRAIVLKSHVKHRITLWQGYTSLIRQKPVVGWGMRAHRQLGMDGSAGKFAKAAKLPDTTTHPHSFILEIWTNLGAIGVSLASIILLGLGFAIDRLPRTRRVAAAQILTTGYVISATGHGFTQTWWIAAITIAVIAASQILPQGD